MKRDVSNAINRIKDIQVRKQYGIESRRAGQPPQKLAKSDDSFKSVRKSAKVKEGEDGYEWLEVTKTESEIKSHTSYLTFAYRICVR